MRRCAACVSEGSDQFEQGNVTGVANGTDCKPVTHEVNTAGASPAVATTLWACPIGRRGNLTGDQSGLAVNSRDGGEARCLTGHFARRFESSAGPPILLCLVYRRR